MCYIHYNSSLALFEPVLQGRIQDFSRRGKEVRVP